jgi:hypothetical protein
MDTPRLPACGSQPNDSRMPIHICSAVIDGSSRFCVVQGSEVISVHDTLKAATDARRVLVLPLPEDRPARNTVTLAVQRGYHYPIRYRSPSSGTVTCCTPSLLALGGSLYLSDWDHPINTMRQTH